MMRGATTIAISALAVLAWFGGAASAADPHGPALEISVIQATVSDAGHFIDPALRDLPQLSHQEPFTRYNVYKLLDRRQFALERDKPITLVLPNGRNLKALLDGVSVQDGEKRYQLGTQIGEPGKAAFLKSLHVTVSENEPFFVGGQSYGGGTLFLELAVRP